MTAEQCGPKLQANFESEAKGGRIARAQKLNPGGKKQNKVDLFLHLPCPRGLYI